MFRRENKRIGVILWLLAFGLISGFPEPDTTTILTASDKPAENARGKEAAKRHRKRRGPVRRRAEHRPVRRDEKSDRAVVHGREDVEARLQQRLSGIEFVETPLEDCLAWFSQQLKLPGQCKRQDKAHEGMYQVHPFRKDTETRIQGPC